MKKAEAAAFGEFMMKEAERFGRAITVPEIETWFETFKRTTLEDFRLSWEQHRKDVKRGQWFPTINDLMRLLRTVGDELIARDWRCAATVGDQRCGYPGSIVLQGSRDGYCGAHFRMWNSAANTDEARMQIIDASREYVQPKTVMELLERGAAQRKIEGERWVRSNPKAYENVTTRRRAMDSALEPSIPRPSDDPGLRHTSEIVDDVNELAALASAEGA
jgi:hypothetical protein